MRRKLWLIRVITRHSKATLVRQKLWQRVSDGLLPRAKDFWKLCEVLGLQGEDFVLSEAFLVEKLREYRRQYVEQESARRAQGAGHED